VALEVRKYGLSARRSSSSRRAESSRLITLDVSKEKSGTDGPCIAGRGARSRDGVWDKLPPVEVVDEVDVVDSPEACRDNGGCVLISEAEGFDPSVDGNELGIELDGE
jgi:hypothetical protein